MGTTTSTAIGGTGDTGDMMTSTTTGTARSGAGPARAGTERETAAGGPAEGDTAEAGRVAWRLPAEPAAAATARNLTRETLARWGACDGEVADDVVLMVDELVTNAVVHGGGAVRLSLRLRDGLLVCEVADASPVVPERPRPPGDGDWGAESGRGLWLVALLATDHGVRPGRAGKTVWFTRALP